MKTMTKLMAMILALFMLIGLTSCITAATKDDNTNTSAVSDEQTSAPVDDPVDESEPVDQPNPVDEPEPDEMPDVNVGIDQAVWIELNSDESIMFRSDGSIWFNGYEGGDYRYFINKDVIMVYWDNGGEYHESTYRAEVDWDNYILTLNSLDSDDMGLAGTYNWPTS